MKRSSSRTVVFSKALKVIDADVRKEELQRRLRSLEADSYVENHASADDEYGNSDDDEKPGSSRKHERAGKKIDKKKRKIRNLDRLIDEIAFHSANVPEDADPMPSYVTIAAGASTEPRRQFCSICGQGGTYTCVRCGSRYCSIKCQNSHKETKCLKFSY